MEWVSWAEAARITGVPVHRVEWWKRAKGVSIIAPRTRCDPRCGGLPSKSSVAGTTHAKPHAGSDAKRSVREGKPSERRPCRMVLDNGRAGCSQGGPVQQDPDQTSQAARRRPTRPAVVDPRGGRDDSPPTAPRNGRGRPRRQKLGLPPRGSKDHRLRRQHSAHLRQAGRHRATECAAQPALTQSPLGRQLRQPMASKTRLPRNPGRPISVDRCTTRGT